MLRTIAISSLAVLIIGVSTQVAQAQKKPAPKRSSVAVLGLEVQGSMDKAAAVLAQKLTEDMRKRAAASKPPYKLAPNSNADLAETKLLNDCESEANACMALIGKSFNAAYLLYGNIRKNKKGYQVNLRLLNTQTARMQRTLSRIISNAGAEKPGRLGGNYYNRITGQLDAGTLEIVANVATGTVVLDGKTIVPIQDGRALLKDMAEGKHSLVIESPGHTLETREIEIKGGTSTELRITLLSINAGSDGDVVNDGTTSTPIVTEPAESRPPNPYKGSRIAFWSTAMLTVAAGGFVAYNWFSVRSDAETRIDSNWNALCDENPALCVRIRDEAGVTNEIEIGDICSPARAVDQEDENLGKLRTACDDGDSAITRNYIGLGIMGASAIAASYFFYRGYIKEGPAQEKPTVRFNPTVTPTVVGGGLTIDF